MPRTGLSARFAIPVLNDRDVMSKIAVPVVSEPVPAVVGTGRGGGGGQLQDGEEISGSLAMRGRRDWAIGRPLPIGALMKSIRSASL